MPKNMSLTRAALSLAAVLSTIGAQAYAQANVETHVHVDGDGVVVYVDVFVDEGYDQYPVHDYNPPPFFGELTSSPPIQPAVAYATYCVARDHWGYVVTERRLYWDEYLFPGDPCFIGHWTGTAGY